MMNPSQRPTGGNNGLSQPVSALAADIFALDDCGDKVDNVMMTGGQDLKLRVEHNHNNGATNPWMSSSAPAPSQATTLEDSARLAVAKDSHGTNAAAAASTLTTSSKDNRQGKLAKQSLLAKMYQNRSARGPGVPTTNKTTTTGTIAGSKRVFSREGTTTTSSTNKKNPNSSMSVDSLLHNSCKLYPTNVDIIRSALFFDAEAIRRVVHLPPETNTTTTSSEQQQQPGDPPAKKRKLFNKRCVYPINIALCHETTKDVVECLAKAGPDVLIQKDGPWEASSLAIALHAECSVGILKALLAANAQQLQMCDRQNALPLHTALSLPTVSLDVVKLLYKAYPDALEQTNVRGETPVQVAERNVYCSESIVNYLQEQAYSPFEENAEHLDEELAKLDDNNNDDANP